MKKQVIPGVRELTLEEMALVGGGWYDDGLSTVPSGTDGLGGSELHAGALSQALTWTWRAITGYEIANEVPKMVGWGVAGAGGNENDNGGTSYGIGVCNSFGCP